MKILEKMASAQNHAKFVWEVGELGDDEKITSKDTGNEKSLEELAKIMIESDIKSLTQSDKLNFLHKFYSEIGDENHSTEFKTLLQKIEAKFNVKYDKEDHEKSVDKVVSEIRDKLLSVENIGPWKSYQHPDWQIIHENFHSDKARNRFLGENPTIQAQKSLIIGAEVSISKRISEFTKYCENVQEMLKENPALPVSIMVFSLKEKVINTYERKNDVLKRIIQFPNVHYVDVLEKGGISDALKNSKNDHDNSAKLGELQHTADRWEDSEKVNKIQEVRDVTGISKKEKTDEEVFNFIKNWKSSESREFNQIYINATAIDWDGTLWKDGKFNTELWEKVKDEPGLFIATGGDLDGVYNKLKSLGIDIGVCAKQKLRGYKIKKLIDDLSQEEIEKRYGITVINHERI